jgi:hypothetical protein
MTNHFNDVLVGKNLGKYYPIFSFLGIPEPSISSLDEHLG